MDPERERDWLEILRSLCIVTESREAAAIGNAADQGGATFCQNPSQYEWKYIGRRTMLLPCICDGIFLELADGMTPGISPGCEQLRFSTETVWIVEGTLRRGESNVLNRRRAYLAGDWTILYGEGFDSGGLMVVYYLLLEDTLSATGQPARWYRAR